MALTRTPAADVELPAPVYGGAGRVIATDVLPQDAEGFFGFDTFDFDIQALPTGEIGKIRGIPRISS